ncbi:MAG: SDR family oxidoreductase [Planctomycetota bacterium]|jgi:nucleoside-diphosphate-sugar epimerase|nr:SDR family oxidoreductase [Planctomycetota bacterium]
MSGDNIGNATKTALFIGGTGTISSSITKLAGRDHAWRLYVLNRGTRPGRLPDGVRQITADINDLDNVKKALSGLAFDVVADFIAYDVKDVARDVELFSGRIKQYIFISSASAYQKPVLSLPISESTPLRNPYWEYSRKKIACEDLLAREYRENEFPGTIVRPSHTYNYDNFPVAVHGGRKNNWQTLLRMREGRPVIIPGDGTSLWTLTHADDFAHGFIGLMGNPATLGHAFHITSDDVLAWNRIYALIADALDVKLNAVHVASEKIARYNQDFAGTLLGDKAHSVYFDNSKLRSFVPRFNPVIRFSDAIRAIIGTMIATPGAQIPDPDFDAWCDMVIAAEKR